jgi:predicted DNA-binding transcriptional regulator
MHILLEFSTLHVKDVDQNFNIPEDVVTLAGKVVFHEGFLTEEINTL